MQYLLRSYATSNSIREGIPALRDIVQKSREKESELSSRLDKGATVCRNVHSADEKITLFVDRVDPTIKSLVARHQERRPRVTFSELTQFARAEGDPVRTRGQQRLYTTFVTTPLDEEVDSPMSTTRKTVAHGSIHRIRGFYPYGKR